MRTAEEHDWEGENIKARQTEADGREQRKREPESERRQLTQIRNGKKNETTLAPKKQPTMIDTWHGQSRPFPCSNEKNKPKPKPKKKRSRAIQPLENTHPAWA